MFTLVTISVSVIIMNLLIAQTVDKIEELMKEAETRMLERRCGEVRSIPDWIGNVFGIKDLMEEFEKKKSDTMPYQVITSKPFEIVIDIDSFSYVCLTCNTKTS